MQTRSRLCRWLTLGALLAGLMALPEQATAGVYDTAVAWWHFDYDPDADNLADLDEIRDQRDWGTAALKGANGKHATSLRGALGGPSWTNGAAFRPAGGQEYGGRSISFKTALDPQVPTNCWPDTLMVSNLGLAGSATLVTRFRWDGYPTELEKMSWLYNNGLEWGQYRGWLFGIRSNAFPCLSFYAQRAGVSMDVPLTNGVWYDVAMVLTDGNALSITNDTVEFYLWPQNGALSYRKYALYNTITNSIGTLGTIIGCEANPNSYSTGNARKSFIGALNHLAVWNRALTSNEVNEAFGNPQPLFQIGLNNGSPMDMRPESEVDADYYPGDPWHTMRRAVTGTFRDATLNLPLTAVQRRVPYVFHVETGTDGQPAGLALVVNGATNETQAAGNGAHLYWYVATNQLVAGTNTFALRYASGPSPYISFDWLELAGSWQVGYDDNSQAEFMIESGAPDDFYVSNPNWLHLERALTSGDKEVNLHFALSPELAAKYRFRYTTRIISQGDRTNHAFSVFFNNALLRSFDPVPDGTSVSFLLDRSLVRGGDNTVKVRYDSAYPGWMQFDFHRLEVLPYPKGTLILMR